MANISRAVIAVLLLVEAGFSWAQTQNRIVIGQAASSGIVAPAGVVTNFSSFYNLSLTTAQLTNILKQVYPTNNVLVVGTWPAIGNPNLPDGTVGSAYSQSLGSGLDGAGRWVLAAGSSLPDGLTLSVGGVVSGTPTAVGADMTFDVRAADTNGLLSASGTFHIYVYTSVSGVAVDGGGTGYTVDDILTVDGGSPTAATLRVTSVADGVIDGVAVETSGNYHTKPTNPVSVTGGTGASATFNLTWP